MAFDKNKIDYTLYVVTDRSLMSTPDLEACVQQALEGGCTLVQLREKELSSRDFYLLGERIKRICNFHNIPLIINDRVDIALALDADGVHVGQQDLSTGLVRTLLGNDKLVGVSVTNVQEALQAETEGADYLGVGAMYATSTKTDASLVSFETLRQIRIAVDLPLVTIGGMNEQTIGYCASQGVDGVAVVSTIVASSDIRGAASRLKTLFLQNKKR